MLMVILSLFGTVALHVTGSDLVISQQLKSNKQALYIAEAGLTHAKRSILSNQINDILDGNDNKKGSYEDDLDNGIFQFGLGVSFSNGYYNVTLVDNDDGDSDFFTDSDGLATIVSTGKLKNGYKCTIEAVISKGGGATYTPNSAVFANGPVAANGNLKIDGRDHKMDGTIIYHTITGYEGINAVTTRSTFTRKGNAQLAGKVGGIAYSLTKKATQVAILTDEHDMSGYKPTTPEEALGMAQTDFLKDVAMSGSNGSQYVTDPSKLSFPLSGVTYVELPSGDTWQSINLGNSSGILIVHNDDRNAIMKNVNHGTFSGIMIVDDLVHLHTDVIGCVINLTETPSSGNVMGNGSGYIKYSSEAVFYAMSEANNNFRVVSWRQVM